MNRINELYDKMITYYSGDPKRTQHFIKVFSLAEQIGTMEDLSANELETLMAAALVHDIGIKPAEAKYGSGNGKLQELEGPAPAGELLISCGFEQDIVERVKYLVGHHHTYTDIKGMDYQILVEADFLVNLYEDECSIDAVKHAAKNIFRTNSGISMLERMYPFDKE